MNRYKAIKENEFFKILNVENSETEVKIEGSELAEVETIYNSLKPEVKEGDLYELISFNLALENGVEGLRLGAYNYKFNGGIINVIIK